MQYIGLDKQIRKNNFNSLLLLIAFPVLLLVMMYAAVYFITQNHNANAESYEAVYNANETFIGIVPIVLAAVGNRSSIQII